MTVRVNYAPAVGRNRKRPVISMGPFRRDGPGLPSLDVQNIEPQLEAGFASWRW